LVSVFTPVRRADDEYQVCPTSSRWLAASTWNMLVDPTAAPSSRRRTTNVTPESPSCIAIMRRTHASARPGVGALVNHSAPLSLSRAAASMSGMCSARSGSSRTH
jgi:hypothetical protein